MKAGLNLVSATVQFFVNKVRFRFMVLHNLPEVHGLSLNDAVNSWVHRTDKFTAQSFCDYIVSKNTDHICIQATKKNVEKYFGKGAKFEIIN